MNKQEALQKCTVENNVVKLPDVQLDRKVYIEVAKALEGIGGKWNKKAAGFIFSPGHEDQIDTMLCRVQAGENINFKKEFQYFPTPDDIAEFMVELADIRQYDRILEPSAGQGAIVDKILDKCDNTNSVTLCELMEQNVTVLHKKYGHSKNVLPITCSADFLKQPPTALFDKIIANPPFTKNQDILHIHHMELMLKPGGRLVSVASNHWKFASDKQSKNFRNWIKSLNADVHDLDSGQFKESGTMVATCIIVINKQMIK
jgi:phospholipid N-methyltransferase